MRYAFHFPNFDINGGPAAIPRALASAAELAEAGGCSTFTLMDHWFQMENLGGPSQPMLEGYTGLGFLAALTSRMRLGLLVTGVTYRHPGLLAKVVTTLDLLSGGRALLGLGAAWYEREHHGLGVPYPPVSERFERLDETVRICRQMWSDDDGPFHGKHYQLTETICVPPPLRPGGIPVLIGGGGERKTLRLVAQHADACNLFGFGESFVAHKLAVLERHCDDVQRDPDEIEKTVIWGADDPLTDPDGFLTHAAQYAALGIETLWVSIPAGDPAAWVDTFNDKLVPRLTDI